MTLTRTQLKAIVDNTITDPLGRQNTAEVVRNVFYSVIDNDFNLADDDFPSPDLSAYLRIDNGNSPIADINWGGFGINNILSITGSDLEISSVVNTTLLLSSSGDNGGIYEYWKNSGLSIDGSAFLIENGSSPNLEINTANGNLKLISQAGQISLKTSASSALFDLGNLTADRTFQLPDISGTILLNSLSSGNIFVGNGSNVATGVSLSLSASGGSFGLSNSGVLTMPNADASTRGLLTSSDWNTFNNKQAALSVQANGSIANNTNVLSFSPKGFLKYPYYFDDFISGSAPNGNWVSSGAGLTLTINNAPGKVGAFGIGTGSVSNGQRAYSLDSLRVVPNAFAFEVTYKIEIINLSTATEEYNCWFGFGDSKPAEGSNEIIFLYKRSASGNFWVTKTVSGGVATTNVSSTAVTASVYYLKMEVNQAMTQVVFKIASGNNGTYSTIATHTTNIPTTGVYPIFSIMGEASSGGTNRLFHIDAFEFESSDGGRTIS